LPRLKLSNAYKNLVLNQRTRSRGGGYNKFPCDGASVQSNATLKIPRGLPRGGSFFFHLSRTAVIQYKDSGHTFAQVYEAFGVSPRSYYVWKAGFEEKGKTGTRYPKSRKGKIYPERLKETVENHHDRYLRGFAAEFGVCLQAIHKMFKKPGINRKKTFSYSEKSEEKREEYLIVPDQIPEETRV
jgi:transposase